MRQRRLIEACRLFKTYGEGNTATHALEDVSFDLCRGEFASIVGQSGSGKSTLLNSRPARHANERHGPLRRA